MLTSAQIERANRIRAAMDNTIPEIKDKPAAINNAMDMIRPWEPGAFNVDDVRMHTHLVSFCAKSNGKIKEMCLHSALIHFRGE